jgi:hypothetical protein
LTPSTLKLGPTDRCSIAVVTGSALRHDRFALRLQAEFPELVIGWVKVAAPFGESSIRRGENHARAGVAFRKSELGRALFRVVDRLRWSSRMRADTFRDAEQRLFGDEVELLRSRASTSPVIVEDPNAPDTVALVQSWAPYLMLTLDVPVSPELRQCARGIALNQHSGWCPEYRGAMAIEWSLVRGDLSRVAATVHVLTDDANRGPIVRRSIACLTIDDTAESILARSVALGTELMCEVIRDLLRTMELTVFEQFALAGIADQSNEVTNDMRREVRRLLNRDFIRGDMARRETF